MLPERQDSAPLPPFLLLPPLPHRPRFSPPSSHLTSIRYRLLLPFVSLPISLWSGAESVVYEAILDGERVAAKEAINSEKQELCFIRFWCVLELGLMIEARWITQGWLRWWRPMPGHRAICSSSLCTKWESCRQDPCWGVESGDSLSSRAPLD